VVASVLVVAAPITAVLQSAANGTTPTWAVLIGQALITTGVAVIALLAIGSARRPARAVS
jgi:drug/metabolite transporter (DMT)-like permease